MENNLIFMEIPHRRKFAAGKSLKTRVVLKSPCACRVEIVAHLLTSGVNGIHR
jgi:hypothetical protein